MGSITRERSLADTAARSANGLRKKSKRLNAALVGSHVAVVIGIVGIIAFGYKAPVEASPSTLAAQTILEEDATVDQIAAATVASTVAQTLDLSIQDNVQNLAVSLNAKTELAQVDSSLLTKPQIVEQNSRKGIAHYTAQQGDTVQSVAAKFGVSEDTVRWANNITVDTLTPGANILVPGTTGVIYKVAPGDTIASVASKYNADSDRIVTFNDLELSGLVPGSTIVVPDGVLPAPERPGYVAPVAQYNGGLTVSSVRATVYGGNSYAYGYCTWWAFNRRAEMGRPIGSNWGNAVTWAAYARAAGVRVDKTPEVGAVIQNGGGWGGLGHVGIVERVNPDGSLYVSDMNYAGWNVVSYRTVPAGQVGAFWYIH